MLDLNYDLAVTRTPAAEFKTSLLKSYRRKYIKMKHEFDLKMRESDELFLNEQQAKETAQRLAHQNKYVSGLGDLKSTHQLLDLLLDLNNSTHIPLKYRFDLSSTTLKSLCPVLALPHISTLPDPSGEVNPAGNELSASPSGAPPDLGKRLGESLDKPLPRPPPSQAADDKALDSLDQDELPPTYLTLSQEEAYFAAMDPLPEHSESPTDPLPLARSPAGLPPLDAHLHNPSSVYNWFQKHHPDVFRSDEGQSTDKHGMKGLQVLGKRRSAYSLEEAASLEAGGLRSPVPAMPTKATKRKREEDAGYRPKTGTPRPAKRKKEETLSNGVKRAKKVSLTNGS
ncbi:MAG: hypothetical protein M1829_004478 [Trizodia sp. TS-e1964]|nr:MAG: hypothetical protein M1829_004478 [Trizodia sp. TS-e1964]